MSEPAVEVDGVSKRYRLYHERNQSLKATVLRRRRAAYEEFWALEDVSLSIPEGSTFGLIGENGSGKSTLLKCVAKILRPERGSISVHGRVSALLELGAGFHPELSGRENVYLNGAILGLSKRELDARFDDIVEFSGLAHFIDTPVKSYSSGMYVRLGFAVAINVEPEVLLVDEILAVGDAEFQQRCMEKFDELRRGGRTIVIVTHALDSIRNLCDQVALLDHGRLRALGDPAQVINDYEDSIHENRRADGTGWRWGSGEAEIERVEFLDADGKPTTHVRTGDPLVVRVHVCAREPIERPVLGIGVHSLDGIQLTGPNVREAGQVPDRLMGHGYIDYRIERMPLLPGTYDFSALLYNYTITRPYDARIRAFRFDVDHGEPREEHGFITLGGSWNLDGLEPSR
jgi:ABC-type polysaccharide/polyol phosphate transport system ATPase subunit